jgi:hypothetical protein
MSVREQSTFRSCLRSNFRRHVLSAQRVVGDALRLWKPGAACVCLLKSALVTLKASAGAIMRANIKGGLMRMKFTSFDAET